MLLRGCSSNSATLTECYLYLTKKSSVCILNKKVFSVFFVFFKANHTSAARKTNEDQRVRDLEISIWHFIILDPGPSSCMWHCSLPDGSMDEMRKEDIEDKKERRDTRWAEREGGKENIAIYVASSAPLIKRQEQGGKREKHLPKTHSPACTSAKTNLSSVIGLTNKLTDDDGRWCQSKSALACFSWCHCGFEAHLAVPGLLVKTLAVADLWPAADQKGVLRLVKLTAGQDSFLTNYTYFMSLLCILISFQHGKYKKRYHWKKLILFLSCCIRSIYSNMWQVETCKLKVWKRLTSRGISLYN